MCPQDWRQIAYQPIPIRERYEAKDLIYLNISKLQTWQLIGKPPQPLGICRVLA